MPDLLQRKVYSTLFAGLSLLIAPSDQILAVIDAGFEIPVDWSDEILDNPRVDRAVPNWL